MPQNDHVVCKKNFPTAKRHQLVRTFSVRKPPNKQLIWPPESSWPVTSVMRAEGGASWKPQRWCHYTYHSHYHRLQALASWKYNIYIYTTKYNLSLNHKGYQVKVRKTIQFRCQLQATRQELYHVHGWYLAEAEDPMIMQWSCTAVGRAHKFLWSVAHIKNLWFRLHFERGPIKNAHFMTWQAKHPKTPQKMCTEKCSEEMVKAQCR